MNSSFSESTANLVTVRKFQADGYPSMYLHQTLGSPVTLLAISSSCNEFLKDVQFQILVSFITKSSLPCCDNILVCWPSSTTKHLRKRHITYNQHKFYTRVFYNSPYSEHETVLNTFVYIISNHNSIFIIAFYTWGNWGLEVLVNRLSKVTDGNPGLTMKVSLFPSYHILCLKECISTQVCFLSYLKMPNSISTSI